MSLFTTLATASCFLLAVAALHDVAARTIPDLAAVGLAAIGIALRLRAHDFPIAMLAALLVLAVAGLAFSRGVIGGGDVKLLAAVGILVPPNTMPNLILTIALAGGVLALAYLGLSILLPNPAARRPATRLARIARTEQWRIRRRASLPYGTAIAAGAVLTLFGVAA